MRSRARVSRGLGALLLTGGALLTAASGATANVADEVPAPVTPAPPKLISAVVTGCQAPCALGETGQVAVTLDPPDPRPGEFMYTIVRFNGQGFHWKKETLSTNPKTYWFTICASRTEPGSECINPLSRVEGLRGAETITAVSYTSTGNPDDGTERFSDLSDVSNAIVATQG